MQDGTATVMRTCSALDVPIIAIFVTKMDDTHDHPYSEEDYLKVSDDVMARWRRKCQAGLPHHSGLGIVWEDSTSGRHLAWYKGISGLKVIRTLKQQSFGRNCPSQICR